ncbi:heat shock factor protein 1 [Lingula anatina]|uniref:Heat shock factor protein 1 n=1 Tax=Lingula anatina TaxID=7574 RepID=A0A1S3JKL7_LINAN|nr:heat shock factor protein 1 [Lingula anatina]|eukprot:XP_013410923.2 heat shock factor protein 1 [Lingula anatina]
MDELLFRRVNKMPTKETENYSAEAGSAVPAFLSKLWTLVEDPSTDELIYWDASGRSFHVYDQGRFAKEVLPLYFKHNNIASFIRQLNMYGFRKVTNVDQGSLKVDKDDMEFAHPYFLKDHEYLLDLIKRKVGGSTRDDVKVRHEDVSKVLSDVKSIRGKQENMNSKLDGMKRENEALWREVASLRQKHMKQQQIVNKLIQFLMHLVGSRKVLGKRKLPLMLNDSSQLEPSCKISRLSAEESHTATPQDPCQVDNKPLIHEVTDLSNLAGIAEQTESIVQSPKPTDNSKNYNLIR